MNQIPDKKFYRPGWSPWVGFGDFEPYCVAIRGTLLSKERCYFLYIMFMQSLTVLGDVVECGVYQGGSASMLAALLNNKCKGKKHLHLFDTFTGIPVCDPKIDCMHIGDFSDTSFEEVKKKIGYPEFVHYYVGVIPQTLVGLDNLVFSLVHLDVDMYQSYADCLPFFWPRLSPGGVMIFDDYGHISCPGARKAVDEFFADKPEKVIALREGQAFVTKLR